MAEEYQERDIDILIRQVHKQMPEVKVVQLQVKWPADDDNLWWFSIPEVKQNVQVEGAACPFLLETDEQCREQALKSTTVSEAAAMVMDYLKSARDGLPTHLEGQLYW